MIRVKFKTKGEFLDMCGFNRCQPRPIVFNVMAAPVMQNCGPAVPAMPAIQAMPNCGPVAPAMPATNMAPAMICHANFETVERVMEAPLTCAPTVIHHHNRVEHLVPCIKTNVHHQHNHHVFLPFEQSEINEVVTHNHGTRPSDQQLCNSIR